MSGEGADDDTFGSESEGGPSSKFMSIILTNLQVNYDGWKAELPPEDKEEEVEEGKEEDKEEEENESSEVTEVRMVQILMEFLRSKLKCKV